MLAPPSCWKALVLPAASGVATDIKLKRNWKTENSTFWMSKLVKTSPNCSGSNCMDQVHVCLACAELPPSMPTLGLAATYLADVFPPLARSSSTWKLCMNMYEHLFLGGLHVGEFFHGLNHAAEESPALKIQISTRFARSWRTGRPVPCLYGCSLAAKCMMFGIEAPYI